ncbi:trimeric intracellular cation channel family protein [Psychrosphaera sp. B3R10]|uniref:Trimeric intracellular cation channel family protein n=1 Tax=Psychrosphaera algicola TaxID=3023714 RepID=A0ABT5FBI5_9GAMM|nr:MULTISPECIES: trimeric intracellular cation channel family protein [unclassified Psychrosphaera]MBU2881207.1 trimeric intracellular cation channel family protein [Psychrosphaera sp. I2R16]MBU2988312.1 trimeric intracellular cation channel family protein [Psychrosphaera sp. B3R10]MDC2888399.1 trimeric intracellular cation channel family protein [Psychrosphaera sp. G1-22]MDO6718522.1 trimeric intracellular cation channel family protein [Psychrosphaera sp. 1_MG-2023]
MDWLYTFDLIGCGVFAISGAILAFKRKMDGVGVLVLAAVTAIGGGTIRDLLLDAPVFWLTDANYFYVIFVASFGAVIWINQTQKLPAKSLEFADALGLALFVVMGTEKALSYGVSDITAIIMGMMTGCFGGMLRDVLANRVPMILQKELYAMCCIIGASIYVLALHFIPGIAVALGFSTVFILRLAAIKWHWQIHVFRYKN